MCFDAKGLLALDPNETHWIPAVLQQDIKAFTECSSEGLEAIYSTGPY